jgi:hypothetical protein
MFIVIHDTNAWAGARWMFWSEDVSLEVVDLSLFPDLGDVP